MGDKMNYNLDLFQDFSKKNFKKCPKNLVSLYETILLGILRSLTNYLKNKLSMWVESLVLKKWIKWTIFENLSTTTKIELFPFCVFGKPSTKSMLIESQGMLGIGSGVYKL
jgi:hypothetical protein